MTPSVTSEDLEFGRRQELHPTALADELGVSRTAVYRAEARSGVRLPRCIPGRMPSKTDYRDVVQGMKPLDAVAFLLEALDRLLDRPDPDWVLPGTHLTRGERNVLYALARANGRILTRDALMDAYMINRGGEDAPEMKIVHIYVCRLRKKLAPLGVAIRNHHSVGYSIVIPDGFSWPWEVSP